MKLAYWLSSVAGLALAMPAYAETISIDLWTVDPAGGYHYVMADEFMKANPDITVNVRSVQFKDMVNDLARAVATGEAPDVTYVDNPDVALFASRDLLMDLKPMIANSSVIKPDSIYPGPLASVTYEDGVYGIPRGANTIALYYNADMFTAAGLDPDQPPTTWAQLYDAAKALTQADKGVYGLAFSAAATEEGTFQFLPWLQMAGGDYNNVNVPDAVRALTYWKAFIDEGIASPDTLIRGQWDSTGTFNAGQAAMSISGPWELPRMSTDAKFDYRVALLPAPEDGAPRASALGEGDNVILASTDQPDAAFKLVEYMYAQMPRVWNEFGYMPAYPVETKDPKFALEYQVFEESMKFARNRGPHPEWQQISKAIQVAIQTTLTGQAAADQALADAQTAIDGVLAQ